MKVIINKSERFLRAPQSLMGSMRLSEKLLKPRGLDYIDLDPVTPETPEHGPFIEKLKQFDMHKIVGATGDEIEALKENLAHVYQEIYNRKLNPAKDIVITPGNRATAMLLCLGLVNPGEAVAMPVPGLAMYRLAAVMAGGAPTVIANARYGALSNTLAVMDPPGRASWTFIRCEHRKKIHAGRCGCSGSGWSSAARASCSWSC